MTEKTITIDYGTHKYDETWEPLDIFCPNCGHKNVWHDTSAGDYYVGEPHICLTCEATFYMPLLVKPPLSEYDKRRLDALRA